MANVIGPLPHTMPLASTHTCARAEKDQRKDVRNSSSPSHSLQRLRTERAPRSKLKNNKNTIYQFPVHSRSANCELFGCNDRWLYHTLVIFFFSERPCARRTADRRKYRRDRLRIKSNSKKFLCLFVEHEILKFRSYFENNLETVFLF